MNRQLTKHDLNQALAALGELLEVRGHRYEVVLIGGANLLLRGVIDRPTKDADLLGIRLPTGQVVPPRELPGALALAIGDVARAYDLAEDWLNLAAADRWPTRDRHLQDLAAMAPAHDELLAAAAWARTHDPSPGFRSQLLAVLPHLGIEDADVRLG